MQFKASQYLVDLPEPTVFKVIDFEKELEEIIADFVSRHPTYQEIVLESDPLKKVFESWAYDRINMKNAYNEDLKQSMLKYATHNNLDVLAANLLIYRRVLVPVDDTTNPPTPAVLEDDESLRFRAQTADRLAQVAGPKSGYERLAIEASEEVKESFVMLPTPVPGEVHLYIRSRQGNGQANKTLIKQVNDFITPDDKRPLNDKLIVKSGKIHEVTIELIATYYNGYFEESVNKAVKEALLKLNDRLSFGDPLTYNLIHATARVPGIQNIEITMPKSDVMPEPFAYIVIKDVVVTRKLEES